MRLLFLSAWCPFPADNGAKLRTYHLLRGLARCHEVSLVSFCPEGDDGARRAHLAGFCREVTLVQETPFAARRARALAGLLSAQPRSLVANHSRAMALAARRQWAARPYDAVIAGGMHMAPYALALPRARRVLEELELARLYEPYAAATSPRARLRAGLTWWKSARYLRAILPQFAAFSVASATEAALAAPLAPRAQPRAVVQNGVDVAACAAIAAEPQPDRLIYPGAISYDANHDAVAHFAGEILPRIQRERPAAHLAVTGKTTPAQLAALPLARGLEFTGYLDDVRPAVAAAWAEVIPLRRGGGTRLKLLEALALGTPVVATPKGAEGLELAPGRELLVADDPADFAAAALRLLGSPQLRRELAERGRRAAARYDWSQSVARLDDLVAQATSEAVQ